MKVLASAGIIKPVRKCTYAANEVSEMLNHLEQRQAIQRPRFEHYQAGVRARDGQTNHVAKENIEIPWFRIFPLELELKKTDGGLKYDRTLIVDIDGESTRRLRAFRRAFPHIRGRCILEVSPRKLRDLWDRFESGKEARPEGDIRLLGYNTLAAPQPVQGARVYLLHGNLHNRYHDDILQILRNTAVAMDVNYSRLIIVERVITFSKAGNDFRKGQSPGSMGRPGSTDRTEQQWRDILNQVGMQVVQIRGKEGTNRNVIEAMVSSREWI
ncbi:MAG: hypothetical protein M1822_006693 [Bathelium mastoideum]|nr:MAG: hypothetical protein M1822_006693 [Bathelium mastoideum]